jgi:hypothetical protein
MNTTTINTEAIADAIQMNVNEFYAKRIDYARFDALSRALYDSANAKGLGMAVKAELLRREKAGHWRAA